MEEFDVEDAHSSPNFRHREMWALLGAAGWEDTSEMGQRVLCWGTASCSSINPSLAHWERLGCGVASSTAG